MAALCAAPSPLQAPDSAQAAFVRSARAATARYHDQAAAIADGYRAVGPESPAMGRHWVQPSLVVEGRVEAGRPQVLEYATIAGRAELVGVAFAVPLERGESPPAGPVTGAVWHSHPGDVTGETHRLEHMDGMAADTAAARVAVLHAWVWLDNPAGVFEPDNWSLPFARLGLARPAAAPAGSAKTLSLLAGGDTYYFTVICVALRPDAGDSAAIRRALTGVRDSVAQWVSRRQPGAAVTDADAATLAAWWEGLRRALTMAIGRARARRDVLSAL